MGGEAPFVASPQSRPQSHPQFIPKASYIAVRLEKSIEGEALPHYKPEHYFPVHIGDVYEARYQITGKFGYGAYSTSWLCRDPQ
jgi:non-specific serine/threonine protein kinase